TAWFKPVSKIPGAESLRINSTGCSTNFQKSRQPCPPRKARNWDCSSRRASLRSTKGGSGSRVSWEGDRGFSLRCPLSAMRATKAMPHPRSSPRARPKRLREGKQGYICGQMLYSFCPQAITKRRIITMRARILIVDDDPDIVLALENRVTWMGHEPLMAT